MKHALSTHVAPLAQAPGHPSAITRYAGPPRRGDKAAVGIHALQPGAKNTQGVRRSRVRKDHRQHIQDVIEQRAQVELLDLGRQHAQELAARQREPCADVGPQRAHLAFHHLRRPGEVQRYRVRLSHLCSRPADAGAAPAIPRVRPTPL